MPEKTKFERTVDVIRSLVEILAICIGGYWTYTTFIRTEEPGLRHNLRMDSVLSWDEIGMGSPCLANLSLDLENKSKSVLVVSKVRRRAWFVPRPERFKGIAYFDPLLIQLGDPDDDETYTDGPFVQTYAPGASAHYSLTWFVENKPDTYSLFRFEVFENEHDEEPSDFHYDWGSTCGSDHTGKVREQKKAIQQNEPISEQKAPRPSPGAHGSPVEGKRSSPRSNHGH